ncbi:ATP-binding cassette domain-containing protein [Paenibacillus senegalensis]|uniref:ATP-binding cassette domain-containing protein n=1 Tax=Paenibacillus senegalensis TaxID=1465766 RepID=UPI0012F978FF|nr:ABC transporter ATP-binding protein [Paenibacillus senegalensis]
MREQSEKLLCWAGWQEAAQIEAARLSGGQQKRLAIALAMVHEPKLLFLDEPTAALDPRARREIHALIRQLSSQGTAVAFTSHDMEEVGRLADRIVLIHQGVLVAEGSPEELCRRYQFDSLEDLYMAKTEEAAI